MIFLEIDTNTPNTTKRGASISQKRMIKMEDITKVWIWFSFLTLMNDGSWSVVFMIIALIAWMIDIQAGDD